MTLIIFNTAVDLFAPFSLLFMQMAAAEVVLLAVLAGVLGPQIILRRLAFFSHSLGAGAFPGLVLAGAWGLQPQLAALGTSGLLAGGLGRLVKTGRVAVDAATAMLLVAALAIGAILASDVFQSGSSIDQLLFGTLLGIGWPELRVGLLATGIVVAIAIVVRRTWVVAAFDLHGAGAMRMKVALADWLLLIAVAIAVITVVDAVGALLVGAVLVIPAATARMFAANLTAFTALTFAIALAEGWGGILLAYRLDVPPGATIAVLAGCVFALAAIARWGLDSTGARRTAGVVS